MSFRIAAICGSLRAASVNRSLIHSAIASAPAGVIIELVDISKLPLFNPDEEKPTPAAVEEFYSSIKDADAFLFAVTEYNYSVSAPLKNALDWGSRSGNFFNDKPGAMMGAGGRMGTSRAQYHFRQIAVFLNLHLLMKPELCVNAFEPGVFDLATAELKDPKTHERVQHLVEALVEYSSKFSPAAKA